jgi:hypothetical protein
MHQHRIAVLVGRLRLAGIDIEPERCDPDALRLIARDLIDVADLLDDQEAR